VRNEIKMKHELISIIVPIYNTEKYLRQCLDSIINQTYTNFEVLLVNDGSTDSSGMICQEYLENDSRFRYFEKENGGVSSARNLGLERSGGAYITFIDSDDWVESNHLEALLKGIKENNADIAVSKHKSFNTEDGLFYFPAYSNQNQNDLCIKKKQIRPFLELFPKLNYLTHDFACIASKLFKKSLTQNLFLDEKLPQSEDLDYFFKLYLRSESIVYIDEVTYIYVQHGQNASHHPSETSALCDIKVHWNMLDFINELNIPNYYYLERIKHLLSYWKDSFPDSKDIKVYETMVINLENDITYPRPLISLVVPIYNAETYLRMCLDSITNQTYSNIEVLLVNDGSSDGSGAICQEFVARDSRFHYIEKGNGGVSDARNVGIARAQGEFLSFVDSDDWIEPTYVEDMYRAALLNDAEVVVSNYKKFDVKENCYWIHIFDDYYETHYSDEELIQQLPLLERRDKSFTTSWGILFARRLFNNISFPKGKIIEDTRTNYRFFAESCRSTYIHKALYNYRVGIDSISSRITEKLLEDVLYCLMERMAVYAIKGWNVADERENIVDNLKSRYNQAKEAGLQNTDIFKRYAELLYLLSD
jgi:capsular polysaccharide biosynthesis protein cpsJ